ncbi:unnamed protein product, partial [Musa banksii]
KGEAWGDLKLVKDKGAAAMWESVTHPPQGQPMPASRRHASIYIHWRLPLPRHAPHHAAVPPSPPPPPPLPPPPPGPSSRGREPAVALDLITLASGATGAMAGSNS